MLRDHCRTHIMLALDVMEILDAKTILSAVATGIDAIKIGLPLALVEGCSVFREIKNEIDLPILADIKIADVPHIARKVSRLCFESGADGITVHGFVGPSAIEACVAEAGHVKDVIVMTETTDADASVFMERAAKTIAKIARNAGASGIQAPGNRPERVKAMRRIVGDQLVIVSCGMGFQGGEEGSAVGAGADFEIYGRSICEDRNPQKAVRRISSAIGTTCQKGLGSHLT